MLQIVARAVRYVREVGPLYAIYVKLVRAVPPWLLYYRHLYVFRNDLRGLAPGAGGPAVTAADCDADPDIRWAGREDAAALCALVGVGVAVHPEMAAGARVAVLVDRDGMQSCCWFKEGSIDYEHWMTLAAPHRTICYRFATTSKPARGRGLVRRTLAFAYRAFAGEGYLASYYVIDQLNRTSRAAHVKADAAHVGAILAFGIGGVLAVRAHRAWHVGRWHAGRRLRIDFGNFAG